MCDELHSEAPILIYLWYLTEDLWIQTSSRNGCIIFKTMSRHWKLTPCYTFLDNHIPHCSLEAVIFCREPRNFVKHSYSWITRDSACWLWHCCALEIGLQARIGCLYCVTRKESNNTHKCCWLFKGVYLRVTRLDKAESSFRACGIYLFNPRVFSPEDFDPAHVSFVPSIAEKETNGPVAILQGDEALPKPSTSTNDDTPADIPACGT